MRDRAAAPADADALPQDLLAPPAPPPPSASWSSRLLRVLARVVLWTLVAVGALRGLLPPVHDPAHPGAAPAAAADRQAAAVATAFLREYLTVDGDAAARAERLGRFTVAGLELDGSVSPGAGLAQYADQLVASDVRPVDGGVEVTVLAHVLQVGADGYRDGGTLGFVVPLAGGAGGLAVRDAPRPASLPLAGGRRLGRSQPVPAAVAQAAARAARQAVVAVVRGDAAALARLGGGVPPAVRPLPRGWRAVGVGTADVTGPMSSLTARVVLRARAPAGASYLVPVLLRLQARPPGVVVVQVDAGGAG
jgi:hypothetical protein